MVTPRLFIFGLGYTSLAIAFAAHKKGYHVSGTVRSPERRQFLREQGIDALFFDEVTLQDLIGVTHILSSIPPQASGDVVIPLRPTADWLGYLSTTGVYGDYEGAWVDEDAATRPYSDRLQRRVDAEQQWIARGGHIFRLAGIYGPGRNALEDVRAGEARRIDKTGQVFSRIHVEDIAQMVLASMEKPNPGRIYNVCDDEPAPAHEVVDYACKLLGVEAPQLIPIEQAKLSTMGQEFYAANRRVMNQRIKEELGIKLYYPTYREGLQALARSLQT